HYVAPIARTCIAPSVMVRGKPGADAGAVTELLRGETFLMLDVRAGWAWGYFGHDHYVGYVPVDTLGDAQEATHVTMAQAPLFTAADIKAPIAALLPAGARLAGTVEGDFLAMADGFVHNRHLRA